MSSPKGKSTRSKSRPVINDDIQITSKIHKKNSKIELCIEVVYTNGVECLVFIDRKVKYKSIIHITTHN